MKRTNIYLTDQQWEALKKLASKTGLSVGEIVRRILDCYLVSTSKNLPGLFPEGYTGVTGAPGE